MPSIVFDDNVKPTKIGYEVPMPGSHTGRRIVHLDLGLEDADFTEAAVQAGTSYAEAAGLAIDDSGQITVDHQQAIQFFKESAAAAGLNPRPVDAVAHARVTPTALAAPAPELDAALADVLEDEGAIVGPVEPPPPPPVPPPDDPGGAFNDFWENLAAGRVLAPATTWGGTTTTVPVPPDPDPAPALFLIEIYGVTSHLGDYGMGRTVRTFTLLPGESTTIRLKTWQSTKESIKESSSIIDSHHQEARDRFSTKIQQETTDKATKAQTEKWFAEAEAKGSWGFGSAKVKGGGSGEYQSGREQFARQASDTVQEHAQEASSKRELSVTSSSETTTEVGEESLVERTIANANMRRTLNFVFRELNQTYVTKFHLKNIRVAYTNGRHNSWREVSLAGMAGLIEDVVAPDKAAEVIQRILQIAGVVHDADDTRITPLELVTMTPDGQTTVESVAPTADGSFTAPSPQKFYRFRRGPISQDEAVHPVDGVLLDVKETIMRTDSVLVEALLGETDALDDFAMEVQRAAATERTVANDRETLLQDVIKDVGDPAERAEVAIRLFGPKADDAE